MAELANARGLEVPAAAQVGPDEHRVTYSVGNVVVNPDKWRQRVLIGTPMTGLVRAEWVAARYSQAIPTNWSQIEFSPFMVQTHIPLRFQVADAENIIAKYLIEMDFEWLIFIEHDNVLPKHTFIRLNDYMVDAKIPVVSGLYFTKSIPPEPLVYRRFGWGCFKNWKMGDLVPCVGHGFGLCLIHASIIRALWNESPEYVCGGQILRRVFQSPQEEWFDPEIGVMKSTSGTTDLQFCERVVKDRIFEKAGWSDRQGMEYPFLVDTNLFCQHIDDRGVLYPFGGIPPRYIPADQLKDPLVEAAERAKRDDGMFQRR